jgi:hypothetical protein
MTEEEGLKDSVTHPYSDQEMAWIGERLDELRPRATGSHFLYWSLAIGFVMGLAAHIGGSLLRSAATDQPVGLAVELLYAFGGALWTGVIVVLFAQVIPEVKRRHIRQAVDAYEAWRRKGRRRGSRRASRDGDAPADRRPG